MSPESRQSPPLEHVHATKRRRTLKFEQLDENDNQTKSQTATITETETLTWKPDQCRNPPTSNRFEPIRSSRNRYKRRKRKHKSVTDDHRQWTFSSRDLSKFKDKFVVVSYNILGVENALKHPDLYDKEVDHFDDLDDLLQMDGFRGVYKARTGDANDGCAIFWKEKLFTLLHQENIEFQNFGLRHNVAQLCVLKMNQSLLESAEESSLSMVSQSQSLVVGNIHVLFNPNRGDIKLGQIRLFLEKAYKLSQEWGGIPVLLAGDLNSSPNSALYQFLASSELDVCQHDRRHISGQFAKCRDIDFQKRNSTSDCNESKALKFVNETVDGMIDWISISRPLLYQWTDVELRLATGCEGVTELQHQLNLCSAYFGIPGSHRTRDNLGEPLATSYHSKFMGTVDYIWHTEELVPVRVLETLPVNILRRNGGLPSEAPLKWNQTVSSMPYRGGAVTILRLCVNWPLQTMVTVPDYRSNSNPLPACSHGEKLWFRKEFQLHGGTASFGKLHYRKVTKAMFMECILR
ncbi:Carbon catabolite repressor protein 4 [Citrus sinensis]|uniref:Carbon catabolite repressor protein 4 n=1 Tax=Citrus sinensis TaxID=2711 RepID=A0ACB8LZQ0_CITSI|nr:Carbon catabolite repressor protein 4 [Citrus sinensis]